MEEKQQRKTLLAVAFMLPLVFIAVVFVTSYIPSAGLTSNFNFVYATCSQGQSPYNYYCSNHLLNLYDIENGRLLEQDIPADLDSDNDGVMDINENYQARLFLHDTANNESEEITFEQAQALTLDERITSPDGVAVKWEYNGGSNFFPFVRYSSRYGYYLTRGNASKELNLINTRNNRYYRDDFRFLGWVIDQ